MIAGQKHRPLQLQQLRSIDPDFARIERQLKAGEQLDKFVEQGLKD
jgi:hypothetical protein